VEASGRRLFKKIPMHFFAGTKKSQETPNQDSCHLGLESNLKPHRDVRLNATKNNAESSLYTQRS
jgi:hypothetical protein